MAKRRNLTVWAHGEKIESCVHFGDCLNVDPIPIEIHQFDPRRKARGRPLKKELIGSVDALPEKIVRFSSADALSLRIDALSNCGGGLRQVVTGTCCITYHGVKACGCAVEMERGSCCSGECCN